MSRAVCRFWQQGNCRNGNNCRFEHPGASNQQNNNRFGPLAGGSSAMNRNQELPFLLSKDVLEKDLTEPERPSWILSAYGPGKDAPDQLFGGYPIEQSFEEIRMHYLQGQLSGNPQGALQEIEGLYSQAQQKIQNALSNLDGALQYIVDSAKRHPNRIDICLQNSKQGGTTGEFAVGRQGSTGTSAFGAQTAASPFGAPSTSQTTPGGFGQPSALGQRPSPFGAPPQPSSFGQPSQLGSGTSAFGQPSQLGSTTSAFGTPSPLGTGTSAFGQPSQLGGTTSAFGQASTLGAKPNPFGANTGFGKPAATTGGFGQPSALGQNPSPFGGGGSSGPSPFAAAAQAQNPSPFGQPQNPSPFGQPAQNTGPNAFGQPSQPQSSNPFGQPPATTSQNANSPFGQPPAATTAGGFGQPPQQSPFGQPNNSAGNTPFGGGGTPSPFGVPGSNNNAAPNAFQQAAQQPSAFGGGPAPTQNQPQAQAQGQGPYPPGASRQHPPIESYSSKGMDGRLQMFKGRQVGYKTLKGEEKEGPVVRNPDGTFTRIWHPDGAPPYTPDTEAADPGAYTGTVLQQWKGFVDTGKFGDGLIPEVPPKREFCAWDF